MRFGGLQRQLHLVKGYRPEAGAFRKRPASPVSEYANTQTLNTQTLWFGANKIPGEYGTRRGFWDVQARFLADGFTRSAYRPLKGRLRRRAQLVVRDDGNLVTAPVPRGTPQPPGVAELDPGR